MLQRAVRFFSFSGWLWAGLFAFAACPVWAQAGQAVSYSSIAAGQDSGIKVSLQTVIRSRSAWLALWRRHDGGRSLPAPAVDFRRYMLVAVFAGESEIRRVTITSIIREPGRLVVRYVLSGERPLPDGPALLASPFHIVRLGPSALPVEFIRTKRFPVTPRP